MTTAEAAREDAGGAAALDRLDREQETKAAADQGAPPPPKNLSSPTPNRRAVPRKATTTTAAAPTTATTATAPAPEEVTGFGGEHVVGEGKDDFGGSPGYPGAPLLSSGGFVNSPAGGSLAGSDGLASPAGGAFGLSGFIPGFGPGNGHMGNLNALTDSLNVSNALYGSILLQQLQHGYSQQSLQDYQNEAARRIEAAGGGEAPRPAGKTKQRKRNANGVNKSDALNSPPGGEDAAAAGASSIVTSGNSGGTRRRSRQKSSAYRGVSRCNKDGRWQARIRVGPVVKYLGRFRTEREAARRYDVAARAYHGARANPNFKEGEDFSDMDTAAADAASNARVAANAAADAAAENRKPQTMLDPPATAEDGKTAAQKKPNRRGAAGNGKDGDDAADPAKPPPKKKGRRASAMPRQRGQGTAKARRNTTPPQADGLVSPQDYNQAALMDAYRNQFASLQHANHGFPGSSPIGSNNPVLQTLTAAGLFNSSGLVTSPSDMAAAASTFGSNANSPMHQPPPPPQPQAQTQTQAQAEPQPQPTQQDPPAPIPDAAAKEDQAQESAPVPSTADAKTNGKAPEEAPAADAPESSGAADGPAPPGDKQQES